MRPHQCQSRAVNLAEKNSLITKPIKQKEEEFYYTLCFREENPLKRNSFKAGYRRLFLIMKNTSVIVLVFFSVRPK
jgi:hypothetical protein